MGESYVEYPVAKKKSPYLNIGQSVLYVVGAAAVLLGLLGGQKIYLIFGLVFLIVGYFIIPNFDLEYEYLYIDKELSIDKIIAKKKRKHVMTINLNKVEFICPEDSHQLDSFYTKKIGIKDFGSGLAEAKSYVMLYHDNGTDAMIKITPNQELLNAVKQVFPRKILDY